MPHQREPAPAFQITEALDWTLPSRQGDFSSGIQIGSSPSLADPSYLPCIEPEKVPKVQGVRKGGETTFSHCGRWRGGV